MFNKEEYKKVMNVPFSVSIACILIILITTFTSESENALKGLIGGYLGLGLGILFIILINLNTPTYHLTDLFPCVMLLGIIALMSFYLITYFDVIAKGEVSGYYMTFSVLTPLFLTLQLSIIFWSLFKDTNEKFLTDKIFALLGFLSVITYIMVIILGIILKFYFTQG
jgi:hypothetical protein